MNEKQKEILMDKMTQNLPALRAKTGLTQAKLADMIGVSRQTLVAVENGKRKMTWSAFLSCFLVFHKNPDTDIIGMADDLAFFGRKDKEYELVMCLDFYTHAVYRNGRKENP